MRMRVHTDIFCFIRDYIYGYLNGIVYSGTTDTFFWTAIMQHGDRYFLIFSCLQYAMTGPRWQTTGQRTPSVWTSDFKCINFV